MKVPDKLEVVKSLREFPGTFAKAVSSPAFYGEVAAGKAKASPFKYFFILTVLLAVIQASFVTAAVVPGVRLIIAKLRENIVDLYPADLTIKITKGEVTTDVPQPYKIPLSQLKRLLPDSTSDLGPAGLSAENLLVVDTKAKADDFSKYKTLALLTKSGMVIVDTESTGGFRYYPIPPEANQTIDRRFVRSLWSQAAPLFNWVIPAIVAVIWVGLLLAYPVWNLIYLLFGALFLMVGTKFIGRRPLSYKTAYKYGLYSITVPLVLGFLLNLTGIAIPVPFFFSLVFLVFSLLMLKLGKEG